MALRGFSAAGVVAAVLLFSGTASAQYGGQFGQFGGGQFGGGGGGGGGGGFQSLQTGLPQQLPPPILRTNWYMYNSVGGMGTTGGTITIPTQFGLQSQFGSSLGGGVAGQVGATNYFGVNYQRQMAYMIAYQQALAYQQTAAAYARLQQQQQPNQAGYPSSVSTASPKSNFSGFSGVDYRMAPKFGGLALGEGQFNPAGFDRSTASSASSN